MSDRRYALGFWATLLVLIVVQWATMMLLIYGAWLTVDRGW